MIKFLRGIKEDLDLGRFVKNETNQKAINFKDPLSFQREFAEYLNISSADPKYVGAIYDSCDIWGMWFAKAKFRLYKTTGRTVKEVKKHDVLKLFEDPNPMHPWWQIAYMLGPHLGFFGNFYIYKNRGKSGKIIGYQYLLPSLVTPQIKEGVGIHRYDYAVGENAVEIPPENIIHLVNPNPFNMFEGMPVIDAISDTATVNQLQMDYSKKFYENGGFLGLTFSTPHNMTKQNFDATLARLKQKFEGVDNSYEVNLMDNDLKPVKSAHNMQEMDITNQRRLTREDIFATFHIPKIMAGLGESVNRDTAESAIFTFTSGTIDPRLDYVDQVLTQFVQNEWKDKSLFIKHDILTPKDQESALTYYDTLSKLGALTINEMREEEGLNKFAHELADVPIINVGGALVRLDEGKQIGVEENQNNGNFSQDTEKSIQTKDYSPDWERFNIQHDVYRRKFESKIQGYADSQSRRVIEALKDQEIIGDIFNIEEEDVLLYQLLEIELWSIMKQGYRYGAVKYDFSPTINRDLMEDQMNELKKSTALVNKTIQRKIGELDNQTEEGIKGIYKSYDASKIAVTGTTGAFNAGLFKAMKDAGIKKKTWLSMRDGAVRNRKENHLMPDNGESIPIDQPFLLRNRIGEYDAMMYPGDPAGSPENIINCRCTVIGESDD